MTPDTMETLVTFSEHMARQITEMSNPGREHFQTMRIGRTAVVGVDDDLSDTEFRFDPAIEPDVSVLDLGNNGDVKLYDFAVQQRKYVNRLNPFRPRSVIQGYRINPNGGLPLDDPSIPNLPAALRMLDAFVCDGAGRTIAGWDLNNDGVDNWPDMDGDNAFFFPNDTSPTDGFENTDTSFDGDDLALRRFNNAGGCSAGAIGEVWIDENNDGVAQPWEFQHDVVAGSLPSDCDLGFSGRLTPGMINLNTAMIEVMRALPHWYRLYHQTGLTEDPSGIPLGLNGRELVPPRVLLAEAVVQYRDRLSGLGSEEGLDRDLDNIADNPGAITSPSVTWPVTPALAGTPNYLVRGLGFELDDEVDFDTLTADGVALTDAERWDRSLPRGERGLASAAEILLMNRPGSDLLDPAGTLIREPGDGWRADFASRRPFRSDLFADALAAPADALDGNPALPRLDPIDHPTTPGGVSNTVAASTLISTDVLEAPPINEGNVDERPSDDRVAQDIEESHLLFSGASNLVTTRSDVFTVYFTIRSFTQSPNGVWDATNQEQIIDERRYVMLVDRSNVDQPGDRPRIVYLERLPR